MKKILLALFSFVFVFSIVGCSAKTETKKEEKVIKMGFVPLKNSEKLVEDLKPISDYLSERLGVKVEAFTASNYIGVVEGLGSGSVDFGIIPPFSSLLAQKQSNAKPILTSKGKTGKPGYTAELYVRKDSGIKSLQDVKGKKVAFVDPSSSSGYIYPGAMLVNAGLNLDKDISYQFSGGHDKSLQLLLNKDVDVIATFDGVEDRYAKDFPQAKTDIQKLATSDMIPGVMVTTSGKMDKELQEKLEKALRDIEKDPKMKEMFTKMFSITGFTDVDQDAYKKVEATAKVMNVDLDKVK
ncbi:MAG: phosphate/phosphite/phosphonate ABC transporter substrate-binding protein [Gemella haemolysans]|uniref:phosphate/phosphite/phosphonate ABC transporter substrate-binding protein n=1 Tax=Gemella haemolysans TaxID=1379 RepID=UPI00290DD479|nr:phosphate/phosphite/phosphonate ABC transporter substrate-binding protein [Gemella haemolysans]MDU6572627.1 phosphate/phosphite/phosphonate ABC transporter substrate-binding protein [Gemella haemolysans]